MSKTTECPDCKGRGQHVDFQDVVQCKRCNGLGEIGPGASYEQEMESLRKSSEPGILDKKHIKQVRKLCEHRQSSLPELRIGDTVHVFDARWYKAEVKCFFLDINTQGDVVVHAKSPCDSFNIPRMGLSFNVTLNRWEYIKAGTPT